MKDTIDMKPNLFIVGAPKSGTTSMHYYLNQHPKIFMSEVKEPHYFSDDIKLPWGEEMEKKKYFGLFPDDHFEADYFGESSTWYLCSRTAARNIYEFNPDSKIIIMLRDPVEILVSLYNHRIYYADETAKTLTEALDYEQIRKKSLDDDSFLGWGPIYDEAIRFGDQIQRYFNLFGKKKVHIILFDEMLENINMTYKEIIVFLDLKETGFTPEFKKKNIHKSYRNNVLKNLSKTPSPMIVNLFHFIIPNIRIRSRLIQILRSGMTSKNYSSPVSGIEKDRLRQRYLSEIEKVEAIIERDLSFWKKYS